VWIGAGATLMPGIQIGTGAVIAAQSVVTKPVAPYTIVGGNPARLLRQRFDDASCERLLHSKWWEYSIADFRGLDFQNPMRFLEQLAARSPRQPFVPPRVVLAQLAAVCSGATA
jgi:hypothetical protein